jgi:hypothetical protein
MIAIIDDTYNYRQKAGDVDYLADNYYSKVCKIYSRLRTSDIGQIINNIKDFNLFCYHKSLQLYNSEGFAINLEDNLKYREALINKMIRENIPRIEFSGGLETDFDTKKINKDLFYSNLKSFLDFYIEEESIEFKILFWGLDFELREKWSVIQRMLLQIRILDASGFLKNNAISDGLRRIYPYQEPEAIIKLWIEKEYNKDEIIQDINNQII